MRKKAVYCLKSRDVRSLAAFAFACLLVTYSAAQTPNAPSPGQTAQAPAPRRGAGGVGRGYPALDPAAVERGQKLFVGTCGFCHGANAKGGETGPDLLRSVVVLDDENGDKIGPVVLNGRPDKGMPKFTLSTEQISDISAFLHERIKAAALRGSYQILNIVVGDPKAGEAYFNGPGQCSTCHSVAGDLAHIAAKNDPVAIQQKIVMPRTGGGRYRTQEPSAKPITATVMLPSGESISGKLDHIDDFNVELTDANGDHHSFIRNGDTPRVEIHDPIQAHMDLLKKYTDTDIHNLTAYLVTLK